MNKILRIYVDTSVIGGCFDDEYSEASSQLIDLAKSGGLFLLVSDVVLRELEDAPEFVRNLLSPLPDSCIDQHLSGGGCDK